MVSAAVTHLVHNRVLLLDLEEAVEGVGHGSGCGSIRWSDYRERSGVIASLPMGPAASGSDPGESPLADGVISVVLADDADDVRLMLRLALQRAGDIAVVGEAADAAVAIELASSLQPEVVVLDLGMPAGGGVEAVAGVRRAAPAAKIIVVSGQDRSSNWEQASAAGASAYVQKGGRPSEIADLVRAIARL